MSDRRATDAASRLAVVIVGATGLLASSVLMRLHRHEDDRAFLTGVVFLAVAVRLLVFALIRQSVGPYGFAPDAYAYETVGAQLVDYWHGLRPLPGRAMSSATSRRLPAASSAQPSPERTAGRASETPFQSNGSESGRREPRRGLDRRSRPCSASTTSSSGPTAIESGLVGREIEATTMSSLRS